MIPHVLLLSEVASTSDIQMGSVIKLVADYGITAVISVVVVIFLIKVLNTLLEQSTNAIQQIIPRIDALNSSIEALKSTVVGAITSHNAASNKLLHEVDNDVKSVNSEIDDLDHRIDNVDGKLTDILVQLEKIEGLIYVDKAKKESGEDED